MAQYKVVSRYKLSRYKFICRLSAGIVITLLASACTIDVDEPIKSENVESENVESENVESENVESENAGTTPVLLNEVDQPEPVAAAPDQTELSANALVEQNPEPELNPVRNPDPILVPTPDPALNQNSNLNLNQNPQLDMSGIAISELALTEMLRTEFVVEAEQIVPTTVWICNDVFSVKRSYYFYNAGVINPTRSVAIERTLNADSSVDDITFFWSVTGTDSVLLSRLVAGDDGAFALTGQQYDVSTIRLNEVDAALVFSAQTLLRGSLTCAKINLR